MKILNKIDALESAIERTRGILGRLSQSPSNDDYRAELEDRIMGLEAELDKAYDEENR